MSQTSDRREFLVQGASVLGLLLCGRPSPAQEARSPEKSKRAVEVFRRLRGPMASVTIPYRDDFSIDFESLRRWVAFACERQVPVLFMTLGDTELEFLTEAEIEAVTRAVVKEAAGRSLVCGGTGPWATRQIIRFIDRVSDCGVDAMNLHFTPRIRSADEYERAFSEIGASTDMPLLAYEVGGNFNLPLVKTIARLPTVIGMKCHDPLYGFQDYARATRHSHFGVLGPGRMQQFLFGHQCGSPAWLCLLATFAPELSLRFYDAMLRDDVKTAREMTFEYEEPVMEAVRGLGWPHTYKSIHLISGHFRTNLMRPPRASHTAEQIAPLRAVLREKFDIGK